MCWCVPLYRVVSPLLSLAQLKIVVTVGLVRREVTPEDVLAWSEVRRGWIESGPTPNATMSPPKWFCIQMGRMPSTVCRFRAVQAHIYRVTYLKNCAIPYRTCFIASMSDLIGVVGHGSLCAFLIVTSDWYNYVTVLNGIFMNSKAGVILYHSSESNICLLLWFD